MCFPREAVSLSTVIDALEEEHGNTATQRRKIVRAEVGIITTVDVMVANAANGNGIVCAVCFLLFWVF